MRTIVVAGVLAAVGFVAGCGTPTVAKADVERQAAQSVQSQLKAPVARVTCDGDLAAEDDQSVRCRLQLVDGRQFAMTATVTTVVDDRPTIVYDVDNAKGRPAPSVPSTSSLPK